MDEYNNKNKELSKNNVVKTRAKLLQQQVAIHLQKQTR
jgi:hypothetical protein